MPTDVDDAGETISAGRNENSAPSSIDVEPVRIPIVTLYPDPVTTR